VLFCHASKNALVPVVTIAGLQFALLVGGSLLTERVFSWPGMGTALLNFLGSRDYVGVQGIVVVYTLVVVVVSLLIDLASALIDPRIRY
jgi:peptide/nickel transport system permease protein